MLFFQKIQDIIILNILPTKKFDFYWLDYQTLK